VTDHQRRVRTARFGGMDRQGLWATLASAFFLGMAPVFGRQAILLGMPGIAVVAIRTLLAALLLLGVMLVFFRKYVFIYPAGMLGCLLAGWVNGLGSLFYYSALQHIGAGMGQLLYSLYPLFLVLWLAMDNQPPSRLTLLRMIIALPAVVLLTVGSLLPAALGSGGSGTEVTSLVGIIEMLIASALYALHLPINQRVLYDMPAPTVTLYTLLAMSGVVVPVFLLSGAMVDLEQQVSAAGSISALYGFGLPVLGLTLVTFLSRLTLFMGVKSLGGMQAALLGLSEVLVTVIVAHVWLGERFTNLQWIGAILLTLSLGLVGLEKNPPHKQHTGGFLSWLRPAGLPTDSWGPHE
jgi:drug/metabolite transporter (DMT)-like permease